MIANPLCRYGLCCMSKNLNTSFQTMTKKKYIQSKPNDTHDILYKKSLHNVEQTYILMLYCQQRHWNYRISSNIFPLATLPEFTQQCSINDLLTPTMRGLMTSIQKTVQQNNIRFSCHPDQFNVLASENPNTVLSTIRELTHQAQVMDWFGMPQSILAPMNLHMNCSKGSITDISDRFIKACGMLPASVMNRLVIENEDKGIWTVENLYKHVYLKTGVPITFDYLHHKCNPGNLTEKEAFDLCVETWKSNIPLFHYAESAPGKNPRAHADMPTNIFDTYNTYVDVDMEFKHKDLAIEAYESLVRK